MYTNISFLHGLRKKRNIKSSFLLYIMLGKLPFVLGYGVYCQNGGSEKIFFQFLTSCKKCLDAGKSKWATLTLGSKEKGPNGLLSERMPQETSSLQNFVLHNQGAWESCDVDKASIKKPWAMIIKWVVDEFAFIPRTGKTCPLSLCL